jgi:hypothetical protein
MNSTPASPAHRSPKGHTQSRYLIVFPGCVGNLAGTARWFDRCGLLARGSGPRKAPSLTGSEIARHAASASRTRLAMSAPRSRSMTAMSYWLCRSSQNWARFPKYRPSLTAVSAVIDRRPFSMSVMRPDGTLRSSASRFALSSRAFNSRLKRLQLCLTGERARYRVQEPRPARDRHGPDHRRRSGHWPNPAHHPIWRKR